MTVVTRNGDSGVIIGAETIEHYDWSGYVMELLPAATQRRITGFKLD